MRAAEDVRVRENRKNRIQNTEFRIQLRGSPGREPDRCRFLTHKSIFSPETPYSECNRVSLTYRRAAGLRPAAAPQRGAARDLTRNPRTEFLARATAPLYRGGGALRSVRVKDLAGIEALDED
jgi:hypothetical protein